MTFWSAVQTKVHAEDKATYHLRQQGYEVFLPKYLKRRHHARRIDWVPAPLFPRYLFVFLDPATTLWGAIRSTVGVSNLVCFDNKPAAVPPAIIDEIRLRQDATGLVKTHAGCGFRPGERVRIINGPLCDQEGLFDCATDEERVFILLNLLGRQVRVRVPLETVYACA